jgi:S-adenosyl-L-methionine hydrolase (adenosine-forming)
MRSAVTLLTDYGPGTEHVGALHAVIAAGCPDADRIDLVHTIPPGDIVWGALLFEELVDISPIGTHLAVVDPGVGTSRRSVAIQCTDGRSLVGPDNGVLMRAADRFGIAGGVALETPPSSSATFHGRDIFAPACARLAAGVELAALGVPIELNSLVRVTWPATIAAPGRIETTVVGTDQFGNLTLAGGPSAVEAAALRPGDAMVVDAPSGQLDGHFGRTFGDVWPGATLVYIDAHGLLAVAINGGNAKQQLLAKPTETIILTLQAR